MRVHLRLTPAPSSAPPRPQSRPSAIADPVVAGDGADAETLPEASSSSSSNGNGNGIGNGIGNGSGATNGNGAAAAPAVGDAEAAEPVPASLTVAVGAAAAAGALQKAADEARAQWRTATQVPTATAPRPVALAGSSLPVRPSTFPALPGGPERRDAPDGPGDEPDTPTDALPGLPRGTPYAPVASKTRWSRVKGYSTLQRSVEIWSFAASFFWKYFLVGRAWTYGGRKKMTDAAVSARKTALARWLVAGLVRLGPTFIKIGQQFSTRVDVLSKEFIVELEALQDNVPAFDSREARRIVETSLGGPVEDTFSEFSPEPIKAASLGQVHLARLRADATLEDGVTPSPYAGKTVVVKVQRPGLKELFDIDLKNVRALAEWFQRVDPKTDGAARDWVAIYDECSRILYQEIDYTMEGRNADRFRKNFEGTDWVRVPEVLWPLSSQQVLVLEYAPGIKVNRRSELRAAGIDEQVIAVRAVESYLQQILRHGFFHADPHPGNVAVDRDTGQLIYYDFGMMGDLGPSVTDGLLKLFYGVYDKDADKCIDALILMGVLLPTPGSDRTAVRRVGSFFLESFDTRLAEQRAQRESDRAAYEGEFKGPRSKEDKKAKRAQILENIGEDLLSVSADQPFRFPAEFTFVVRSFTVLDGIGKALNKKFDITEISAPYAKGLLLENRPYLAKWGEDLRKGVAEQNRAVKNLFVGPNKIDDIARFTERLENGDLKLRVRALEAERALTRVSKTGRATVLAVVGSALANVGTVLTVAGPGGLAAGAAFVGAGICGLGALGGLLAVRKLEKKERGLKPGAQV